MDTGKLFDKVLDIVGIQYTKDGVWYREALSKFEKVMPNNTFNVTVGQNSSVSVANTDTITDDLSEWEVDESSNTSINTKCPSVIMGQDGFCKNTKAVAFRRPCGEIVFGTAIMLLRKIGIKEYWAINIDSELPIKSIPCRPTQHIIDVSELTVDGEKHFIITHNTQLNEVWKTYYLKDYQNKRK